MSANAEGNGPKDDQRRLRALLFLERIVRITSSELNHADMLKSIIQETVAATDTQVCSLYLWDPAEKALILTATNGLSPVAIGQVKLGLGEGVTGWVAAECRPLAVPDVRAEPRFKWVPNLDEEQFVSMLSVPIVLHDRVAGVMNVQSVEAHVFDREEIEFASTIAAQLGAIIEMSVMSHRLEKQLELERDVVARLRALDASKSSLMSTLSHDFRGPLTIAHSYLFGLMAHLQGEDQAACEEIVKELQNLGGMVENIMVSLELEAQHSLVLDKEDLELVSAVEDQSRRMQRTTETHTIDFTSAVRSLVVTADRLKVQTVVVNLLGNAIKYTPTGGHIRVEIDRDGNHARVSVTDTGIGLGSRNSEALFERYGRGETALDHGIGGHGLGLFICREIIEAHGGRIYAQPLDRGTRFVFTLPVDPQ